MFQASYHLCEEGSLGSMTGKNAEQSETDLVERGVHLRVLLEGLADAVLMIDERGEIHAAGAGVEKLLGYQPREVAHESLGALFATEDRAAVDDFLVRLKQSSPAPEEVRMEAHGQRKDGSTFWAELLVRRVDRSCSRSDTHFVGTIHDLTARRAAEKKLARSERRLRAVFNQEFQFVGLMKPDGVLIEVNQPVLDLAQTTRERELGRPIWETIWWSHSPELQERVKAWTQRSAAGEFIREEVQIQGADGNLSTVDFSIKPLHNEEGEIEFLIPEGRDITELVEARRRESSMLEALAEIGESASILAHEVKNPITAINLALRAVADSMGQDESALVEDLVVRMQRLERQIRRTLSFTRPIELQAGEMDLVVLADSIIADLRPEFELHSVALQVDFADAETTLIGDEVLLGEVITNLLRNALEALVRPDGAATGIIAPQTREPQVDLKVHPIGAPPGLELIVDDNGPGIPESKRPELFRPFFTTKAQGTGLGLALCRKILREHGGSIEIEANPTGGARFLMRLPLGEQRS